VHPGAKELPAINQPTNQPNEMNTEEIQVLEADLKEAHEMDDRLKEELSNLELQMQSIQSQMDLVDVKRKVNSFRIAAYSETLEQARQCDQAKVGVTPSIYPR